LAPEFASLSPVTIVPPSDLRPENRRRSQRLKVRIPVSIRLQKTADKKAAPEKTHTMAVNAHGALVLLASKVEVDQLVVLENLDSHQELLCRVTNLGASFMGKTQVALEFIMPAPGFWGVTSPPKDWKAGRG
jgi:hypothetical protein